MATTVKELWKKRKEGEAQAEAGASPSASSGIQNLLDRRRATTAASVQKEIIDRTTKWLENSNTYIKNYQNRIDHRVDGDYVDDGWDAFHRYSEQLSRFDTEASAIKQGLETYGVYYDPEFVKQINDILDGSRKTQAEIVGNLRADRDYWDSFTREEYETAYDNDTYGKKYDGSSYADVMNAMKGTSGRELAWLEKNRYSYMSSEDAQAEIDRLEKELKKPLGGIFNVYSYEDMEADKATKEKIEELKRIRRDAERRETQEQYDAKAEDAAAYAAKVKAYRVRQDGIGDVGSSVFGAMAPSKGPVKQTTPAPEDGEDLLFGEQLRMLNGVSRVNNGTIEGGEYMTEKEKAIYEYLLATEGVASADGYVAFLQEDLNRRSGAATAEYIQSKPAVGGALLSGAVSLTAGADAFLQNLSQFVSKEELPSSAIQHTNQELLQDMSGFAKTLYQTGYTVGNMLPSILISQGLGALGVAGNAASLAGTATMGASASGGAYRQALSEGYDTDKARSYSLLVGASEAGLQYLLGGIGALGGVTDDLLLSKVSQIDNALARLALSGVVKIGSEVTEEELQNFLEPAFRSILFGEDYDAPTVEELLETAIVTALSTGLLESGSVISEETERGQIHQDYRDLYGENAAELIHEALELDPDNTFALKQQARLETGKSIKGAALKRLVDQNEQSIQNGVPAEDSVSGSEDVVEQATNPTAVTQKADALREPKAEPVVTTDSAKGEDGGVLSKDTFTSPEFSRYEKGNTSSAMMTDSGESIVIEGVKAVKDGELTFRLADGREVSSADITYASDAEAELYAELARSEIQPGVMKNVVDRYDGKTSAKDYVRGVETAYLYGWAGIPQTQLAKLPQIAVLNEVQKGFAYELGRVRALDEDTKKATKLKSLVGNSRQKGNGKKGRVIWEGVKSKGALNERQRASKGFCETAAKILGVNIHLFESDAQSGKRGYTRKDGERITDNGFYDPQTGDIWLDINAGANGQGLTVYTLAHELTHFIRQWSPVKFRKLADFLMETYAKTGISAEELIANQQDEAEAQGRTLTYGEAYEEVVANSMETLLNDGRVMERIAALKKRDGTLADKILGYIRRFVDRVKAAYAGMDPDSDEGRIIAVLKDELATLQERFADALYDASETFKKTDVSQMETSERVKNQARIEYQQEIDQWKRDGMPDGELFVLGYTGDVLQGLGAIESDIYMLGDKMKTILADHAEMTLEEIKKIPQILEDPILILKSRNVGRGNRDNTRLVIFGAVKATNGKPVLSVLDIRPKEGRLVIDDMQKVVSSYTKDNDPVSYVKNSDVLYADKKRTASLLRTIGFQTPIELNVSGSIGSISYSGQNVNIEGKNFSEVFSENVSSKKSSMRREGISNRSLLANALESVAQTDVERNRLSEYKEQIGELNAAEDRLHEINRQIREISFGKGVRDFEKLKTLQKEAEKVANRINLIDRKLLHLEAAAPLLRVLDEAKKQAAKKAKEKAEKRAQETEDRRDRTVMRDKIKKKVNELNRLLVKPTKEKHIPNWLQRPAVELLSAINSENDRAVRYYGQRAAELQESLREAKRKQEILDGKHQNTEAGSDAETALQEQLTEVGETIKALQVELDGIHGKYYKASEKLKAMVEAYKGIMDNDNPEIAEGYHPEIADKLDELAASVGDIPISAMTVQELDVVYQAITVLDTAIRNANKFFNQSRNETITATAKAVYTELRHFHKKLKATGTGGVDKVASMAKQFGVNNLKPYVAAKLIGSDTLSALLEEMAESEMIWARDMDEAKAYYETVCEKTGADEWDMSQSMTLKLGGNEVTLSLGQVMSLYAYSRRRQAIKHLVEGGFVHGNEQEVKTPLGKKGKVSEKPNRLTEHELTTIGDKLTKEQREFVQRMQSYLSVTTAKKGNSVSEILYGIDLFGEEFYFPIKSKDSYLGDEKTDKEGKQRTKNLGMTKATVSHANSPVVLSDFMKVWSNHVNDMSLYHGVLGVEDFSRVWNTKFRQENGDTVSLQDTVKAYCGEELFDYFEKLIDDANKGVRKQSGEAKLVEFMANRMKKGATYASLSVVVQQRTSEARAYAYIPERFFEIMPRRILPKQHRKAWEEMKKHCPLAVIKEMGGYDMTGGSTEKWIAGSQKFTDKIDDIAGWLPAHADEVTWVRIWEAAKNMAASLRDSKTGKLLYEKGSDEMLRKAADIASECLRKTQVYDSVFTRSSWMRSQKEMSKMLTVFMAEPTTTVSMLVDSALNLKRGGKVKTAGREISAKRMAAKSLYSAGISIVAASLAKAVIMAMRDDDEEKTYVEKYLYHASRDLVGSGNPLEMIPWVKDVVSIFQGYDVSRNDLQIISDIKRAVDALQSEEMSWDMKLLRVATPLSSIVGLPVGNVMKDLRGMYYTLFRTPSISETTGVGLKDALLGTENSNGELLYEAYLSGDAKAIERYSERFKTEDDAKTALRKVMRERDSRIRETALSRMGGDWELFEELMAEMKGEKIFDANLIISAVNSEENAVRREQNKTASLTVSDKEITVLSLYYAVHVNEAFERGDTEDALRMIEEIVAVKVENGKNEKDARAELKRSMTSYWRDLYVEADKDRREEIFDVLVASGLYGTRAKVRETVKEWLST